MFTPSHGEGRPLEPYGLQAHVCTSHRECSAEKAALLALSALPDIWATFPCTPASMWCAMCSFARSGLHTPTYCTKVLRPNPCTSRIVRRIVLPYNVLSQLKNARQARSERIRRMACRPARIWFDCLHKSPPYARKAPGLGDPPVGRCPANTLHDEA